MPHSFQQFPVKTHLGFLHQIKFLGRQYLLELRKISLVQTVGSDTGIVHAFHNHIILGFGGLFVLSLTNQTPRLVILLFFLVQIGRASCWDRV